MQRIREQKRSRKRWLLLLLLLLLPMAGAVVIANSGGDNGGKPGSDVLGKRIDREGALGVTFGKKPNAGVSGQASTSPLPASPGTVSVTGTAGAAANPSPPDTTSPQPPSISKMPEDPTFDTTAHFKFTGSESRLGFRCRLDGGPVASCNSGTVNYNNLSPGEHTFKVFAVDAAGNESGSTSYTWTILLRSGFEITGSLDQALFPGASQRLNLSLGNPYNFPLRVLGVQVTVEEATTRDGAPNPGCIGSDNLAVLQGMTAEVVVPANSTRSLSQLSVPQSQWPLIQMRNLSTNQDACKNNTFKLSYTGTATKS